MPDSPNKLSQFWQELKRRKVSRVIAVYAAAAFVILELTDIVAPSLGLPYWTLNFIIVLLCAGFIIAIYLSWIYDFTTEGIKRTEAAKVAKLKDTVATPGKRRLRVSDIINAVLVVVVLILAYPHIFQKYKFEEIRDKDGNKNYIMSLGEGRTYVSAFLHGFQLNDDNIYYKTEEKLRNLYEMKKEEAEQEKIGRQEVIRNELEIHRQEVEDKRNKTPDMFY